MAHGWVTKSCLEGEACRDWPLLLSSDFSPLVVRFTTRSRPMPEIQKVSIALTGEQVAALKAAVETGEYATTSEVVREALREWQWKREQRTEELKRLQQSWQKGKASGSAAPLDP